MAWMGAVPLYGTEIMVGSVGTGGHTGWVGWDCGVGQWMGSSGRSAQVGGAVGLC
jgi:hypothetical protein